jgi:hypothetical protein
MNRYRFSCTIDSAHLNSLISAATAAGGFDPEITVSLIPVVFNTAPVPEKAELSPGDQATTKPKKPARKATKRVHANGGEWPAPNSIYDVVLQALKQGPQSVPQLRGVLQAANFSPQSVNSSLARLEKAQKAKNSPEGWVAA